MSYELCRDLGHPWRLIDSKYLRGQGYYLQHLQCPNCGSEKDRKIDLRGRLRHPKYLYVEGYVRHGQGRMTAEQRAEMRLDLVQDQTHHYPASPAEMRNH